ncbi:hypothetical protein D3C85_978110 [compost metagenome]
MNSIIKIIEQYNGKELTLGRLDCLTMLFSILGRDDLLELTRDRYKTVRGGLVRLPKLTGITAISELLVKTHKIVDPRFVQDYDLLVQGGTHTFVYFQGSLFGVFDNAFQMKAINLPLQVPNSVLYRLK